MSRPTAHRLLALHAAVLVAAAFGSCEQDTYDKGDSTYSYLRADFVEAYAGGDRSVGRVVTDDGEALLLQQPYTASWIQTADTVYRALLYYSRPDGGEARVHSMSRVATLSVKRDALVAKGWHSDPVGLETVWVSPSRRYLNMGLVLMTGATPDDARPQAVGLVLTDVEFSRDSTVRTACIELSHQQGDVPEYYSQRTYISVPLQELTADSLRLTVNTYSGTFVRTFPLRE